MPRTLLSILFALLGTLSLGSAQQAPQGGVPEALRFNRDVRPILSDRCFRCHGPDANARKAKLRLDTREGLLAARKDGARVVRPGNALESLLVQRIRHADDGERMPPPESGKTLSAAEKDLLARWIDDGAQWEGHWAYARPGRPVLPARTAEWGRNAIDRLLLARFEALGLEPSAPADPRTLVRRLHFDVLGMPPEPDVVERFAASPSDEAWDALVDEVLASPHHAERLTMYWLDLVRYGDSCGIHGDQEISMSPYRDWVLHAFRDNKPFDVFTREQIAGDLLPNATVQQRIASGYNRLNPKTAEGGAQDKEYLAKYAADRVRTTATTWLGSTLGCAECHDHKFDPFTAKDFYRFAAYFADLDTKGYYGGANSTGNWGPRISMPTPAQAAELARRAAQIEGLEKRYAARSASLDRARDSWARAMRAQLAELRLPKLGAWRSVGPFQAKSNRAAHEASFGPERDARASARYAGGKLGWRARPEWNNDAFKRLVGGNSATYVLRELHSARAQPLRLSLGSDDSIKVWLNGELVLDKYAVRGAAPGQEKLNVALRAGRNELLMKISNGAGGYGFYFGTDGAGPPSAIATILSAQPERRTPAQARELDRYFRTITPLLEDVRRELAKAKAARTRLEKSVPTSLVSVARATPRVTRVLARGDWQDETGEIVEPGVPGFLRGKVEESGRRETRLDLAKWLTSRDNPLTARVFVNRLWKLYFGRGLSRTLDDLGSQGREPENAALLDWLAVEFMERAWDVRAMSRLILTSAAYRQTSQASDRLRARDPENREFARQGRYRHDAEVIRDNALAISGLLVTDVIGGPSVKPYQPLGYWSQLNFPRRRWMNDTGSKQYRRGLYTHWQRTFLHPSLVAFDAPPREECTAERARSNTPLQALVLLNDPSFVEAARVLAAKLLREAPGSAHARFTWLYRRAIARRPNAREVATLDGFLKDRVAHYRAHPEAAAKITKVGLASPSASLDIVEHVAWTAVARAVLNLHETNTRY